MRQAGNHENILKIYERARDQDFVKKGKTKQVDFIAVEYAKGGCLFDLVHKNKLSEDQAKFFGIQMVNGIQHMHSKGVCHRDLKPDNLLLSSKDKDAKLKIADFGESAPLDGWHDEGFLSSYVGTRQYMAPEIIETSIKPGFYDGPKTDVYSAGIILMQLVMGFHPFNNGPAIEENKLYKGYLKDQAKYWGAIEKSLNGDLSDEFKDLANQMISLDPDQRIEIGEVINHPWFKDVDPNANP